MVTIIHVHVLVLSRDILNSQGSLSWNGHSDFIFSHINGCGISLVIHPCLKHYCLRECMVFVGEQFSFVHSLGQ